MSVGEFFDAIWQETEGFVYLPTGVRAKDGITSWKKTMFKWPEHKKYVLQHVSAASAEGREIYYSPALYSKAEPTQSNVLGSHYLWVDFDGNAPDEWAGSDRRFVSVEQVDDLGVPAPTIRVQSSELGNQHVYWKLNEFLTDVKILEEKNRALAYLLKADTSGWDANQILRPPHTTNHKRNMPVSVAEETSVSSDLSRFDFLKPARQVITAELEISKVEPIEPILANYTWDPKFYELFTRDEPTGDRSAALMQLGHYGAETGMTEIEIFSILIHADDRWGKFKNRQDRVKRLSDIVNKAKTKHSSATSTIGAHLGLPAENTEVEVDRQLVYNYREFLASDFHVEWLIPGMLSRGGSGILASAPGVGKTQLSIRLGMALALQQEFLGWNIPAAGKSFFLSLEMAGPPLKHFVEMMAAGLSEDELDTLAENFHFMPLGEAIPLTTEEGKRFLEGTLVEYKPDLLIIDSLGKLVPGSLSDDEAIRVLMGYLQRVRVRYGCAVLIIHHNRKASDNNKKPNALSDIYGSQYITSEADYVASLYRDGPDIIYSEVKSRLAAERPPFAITRAENLTFILASPDSGDSQVAGEHLSGDTPSESGNGVFELK